MPLESFFKNNENINIKDLNRGLNENKRRFNPRNVFETNSRKVDIYLYLNFEFLSCLF